MSKVFDAYYKKAVKHAWTSQKRYIMAESADEAVIKSFNDIWQPAMDFVQDKLSSLSDGDEKGKLFLEALQGVLANNQIRSEDAENLDNKTIRQRIDGLTSKLDSILKDASSTELGDYVEKLSAGLKSFKNRIDIASPEPPAGPEGQPPEGGAPPEGQSPAPEGGQPPEGGGSGGPPQPPPDQNSGDQLLKDLNLA